MQQSLLRFKSFCSIGKKTNLTHSMLCYFQLVTPRAMSPYSASSSSSASSLSSSTAGERKAYVSCWLETSFNLFMIYVKERNFQSLGEFYWDDHGSKTANSTLFVHDEALGVIFERWRERSQRKRISQGHDQLRPVKCSVHYKFRPSQMHIGPRDEMENGSTWKIHAGPINVGLHHRKPFWRHW